MSSLSRGISSIVSKRLKRVIPLCNTQPFQAAHLLHSTSESERVSIVSTIFNFLKSDNDWETWNRNFRSLDINDAVIEQVLIKLNDPPNANRALGFFHWSAKRKDRPHEIPLYCLMINSLVRAGLVTDAQALLESIVKKSSALPKFSIADSLLQRYAAFPSSPILFDFLVRAYAKARFASVGFDVLRYLGEKGFPLTLPTMNKLIHVAQRSSDTDLAWKVFEHMHERRMVPNRATIEVMVSAMCKEGKLQETIDFLERIIGKRTSPIIVVNTHLLVRIFREGRTEDGLSLLERMFQRESIPETIAYSLSIQAKAGSGNLAGSFEDYKEMKKRGLNPNSLVYSSFIKGFCRSGKIKEANRVLKEMKKKGYKVTSDVLSDLVRASAEKGDVKRSFKLCGRMIGMKLCPNLEAFNGMLKGIEGADDAQRANDLLSLILEREFGFKPNGETYWRLIYAFCRGDAIEEALKLYYEMDYRSFPPGLEVFTCLISCMVRCERMQCVGKFLRIMRCRSVVPNESSYENVEVDENEKAIVTRLYNEMFWIDDSMRMEDIILKNEEERL